MRFPFPGWSMWALMMTMVGFGCVAVALATASPMVAGITTAAGSVEESAAVGSGSLVSGRRPRRSTKKGSGESTVAKYFRDRDELADDELTMDAAPPFRGSEHCLRFTMCHWISVHTVSSLQRSRINLFLAWWSEWMGLD